MMRLKQLIFICIALILAVSVANAQKWNVDFQGNYNHNGIYGQTDPVDMTEPNLVWNIFQVQSINVAGAGSDYDSGPISMPLISDVNEVGSVVLTIGDGDPNTIVGWSGQSGEDALIGDWLLALSPSGDGHFDIPTTSPLNWKVAGLTADSPYLLTFYHGPVGGRGLDFEMNGETLSIVSNQVATILVDSDASGEIIGTAAYTGNEGNWAGLVIEEAVLPVIEDHPDDQFVAVGENAEFSIAATDPLGGMLSYQWFYDPDPETADDESELSGETTDTLSIDGVAEIDEGYYYCVVTTTSGSTTSNLAGLFIKRCLYHWPLNGDGVEANGTGYNGTLEGGAKFSMQGAEPNDVASVVGDGSLLLDGVDDFMNIVGDVPLPAVGSTPGFTVTFWARPNSLDNPLQGLIGKFGADAGTEDDDAFTVATATSTYGGKDGAWLSIADGTAANWASWTAAPEVFVVSQWTHIAFAYSAYGDLDMYLNGELYVDYNGHGLGFPDLEGDLRFGHKAESIRNVSDPESFFSGRIDDVKIFNYVLSPEDAAKDFTDVAGGFVCVTPPEYDLDDDCRVGISDIVELAGSWLDCNLYPDCF